MRKLIVLMFIYNLKTFIILTIMVECYCSFANRLEAKLDDLSPFTERDVLERRARSKTAEKERGNAMKAVTK